MNIKGPFSVSTDLLLSNITIRNCAAGALTIAPPSANASISVTITNSRFLNNSRTNTTNTTTSSSSSSSSSTNSTSSPNGGAIAIRGRAAVRLVGCTFINNTAAAAGGAVHSTAGQAADDGGQGSLELVGCAFVGNRGSQGAAVAVAGGVLAGISASNFSLNSGSAAVYLSQLSLAATGSPSEVAITQAYFSDNAADGGGTNSSSSSSSSLSLDAARSGGGLLVQQNSVAVRISDCTFRRNTAMQAGGAIAVTSGEKAVTLQAVNLYDNKAGLYGGALAVTSTSTVTAAACSFTNNTAVQGGAALVGTMSSLELATCNLTANSANKFAGAISVVTGASAVLSGTTLQRNQAPFAGAVECMSCDTLTATGSSFMENSAAAGGSGSGGALVVYAASGSVTLTGNVFRGNAAATNVSSFSTMDCSRGSSGAGGALCASITAPLELRNNTWERNTATTGGAMFVTRQCAIQADDSTCESATANLYDDNRLSYNTAVGGAGGAVYALNVSALDISCLEGGVSRSYKGSQGELATWPYGADGCNGTWYGNSATAGGYGNGLATGLVGLREAAGQGDSRSNVSSNAEVNIVLQMYDALGTTITRGTYEASGTYVAVWLGASSSNLTRYLAGGYSTTTDAGVANFSALRLRAPPGTYNLSFYALPVGTTNQKQYKWVKLSLELRACKLGEMADSDGEECLECSGPDSFGFNPRNDSCDACPEFAACSFNGSRSSSSSSSNSSANGSSSSSSSSSDSSDWMLGYLVPIDGYWHSSPFSPQMHECPTIGACTYVGGSYNRTYNRSCTLGLFQETYLSVYDTNLPTPNDSVLYDINDYWRLQCGPGYTGRLCGQCDAPNYGWRSNDRCYECPPLGLNTLYYILSYCLTVALLAWTVRATLGRSLGESRAMLRAVRSTTNRQRGADSGSDGRLGGAAAGDDDDDDDGDNEVVAVGGGDASGGGGRSGGDGGVGSFLFATDANRSGSGRRRISEGTPGGGGGGGGEFSRRSRTFSVGGGGVGGGSRRGSFGAEGGGAMLLRSGGGSRTATISGSGALDGDGGGGRSRRVSSAAAVGGGGILELAAAAAMAQLEAEAARKGGRDVDDDGGGGGGYGDGGGYGYVNGGGFGGRLSGGAFAGTLVVDPSQGSAAPLLPAVLPGMKPNIRARVPRSVLARESRLANSSGGGGGDATVVRRVSEGSDGSDGEQPAGRRHRLSRMSRAADLAAAVAAATAAAAAGGNGGVAAAAPRCGPVAEGNSPVGRRSMDGGDGGGSDTGPSGTAWFDGLRRRKPGEADGGGGGGGEVAAGDGGGKRGRGASGGGAGESSGSWLNPVSSYRRQSTALRAQLKEDEAVREEKPPYAIVLKILINFLQVTSVARSLDLDFPSFIDDLWNVGSMASSAMTTLVSIDCSLPTNGISKAIQRTVLYVAVPWIFILLSLPVWVMLYGMHVRRRRKAQPTLAAAASASASAAVTPAASPTEPLSSPWRKVSGSGMEKEVELVRAVASPRGSGGGGRDGGGRDGGGRDGSGGGGGCASPKEVATALAAHAGPATFGSYMATRVVVTMLVIIFYFYPSVTDYILSIYQCTRLDEDSGAYAGYLRSVGYFWDFDYDLRCFSGPHLVLTLVVAAPGLAGWAVGVPAGSALWLRINAARGRLNQRRFSDRYGFLYEDYRRTAYYWESVIMARKLLVVGLLLVTNSSEDIMQVLAVMGVVVVAGGLQLYFRPYAQARFNSLECFSLGSTLVVLYLCAFFLLEDLGTTAKQTLSVFILLIYVATLAWFLYCMAVEAWRYGVRVLDADGDGRVTRGEVRAWLGITLGGPLSRLVAFVAAPRWWRRQRRRRDVSGGGGRSVSNVSVAALSGKSASAPPPLLVVVGQPSPLASPARVSLPVPSSPPPPPPTLPQWIPSPAAPPSQLKLPPPSPRSPPYQPPASSSSPPQGPQVPSALPPATAPSAFTAAGEPVYESYTVVMDVQFSQELSPTVSAAVPPPPAAPVAGSGGGGGGGAGGARVSHDAARRPSGSLFAEPPPAAAVALLPRRGPSDGRGSTGGVSGGGGGGSQLVDIEAGASPGSTALPAEAAAMLTAPGGSLPGTPLEGASRDGGPRKSSGSRGSLAAAAAGSAAESRRGSRLAMGSRGASVSGIGEDGVGGAGPRATAALALQASRPGSPATGGGGDVSSRVPSR